MMEKKPLVAIVMGSENDLATMAETADVLAGFGIPYDVQVISAHRTPDRCRAFARQAQRKGIKVIVAGAGKAAHLAGVIASHTTLPVIGVPLDAGLNGLDAVLSTVQMPRGVPVAAMSLGKSGAANAGLFAAAILALGDPKLVRKLVGFRCRQSVAVVRQSRQVRSKLGRSKAKRT